MAQVAAKHMAPKRRRQTDFFRHLCGNADRGWPPAEESTGTPHAGGDASRNAPRYKKLPRNGPDKRRRHPTYQAHSKSPAKVELVFQLEMPACNQMAPCGRSADAWGTSASLAARKSSLVRQWSGCGSSRRKVDTSQVQPVEHPRGHNRRLARLHRQCKVLAIPIRHDDFGCGT